MLFQQNLVFFGRIGKIGWKEFMFKEKEKERSNRSKLMFNYKNFLLNDFASSEKRQELAFRLGGKGASMAAMTALGMPVPDGFVLSTTIGLELKEQPLLFLREAVKEQVRQEILQITNSFGARFGNTSNPLLVSVRSGAYFSMPGMMDTIMNVGITENNIPSLSEQIGEKQAWECYRLFCLDWIASEFCVDKNELIGSIDQTLGCVSKKKTISRYKKEVVFLKEWLRDNYQTEISQDPWKQLFSSIEAIYKSYYNFRAEKYRHHLGLPTSGFATAVSIVAVVFGNLDDQSGSGVLFSHKSNGERHLHLHYAPQNFGDQVVAGLGSEFSEEVSLDLKRQLEKYVEKLEEFEGEPIDIEFVLEKEKLFLLQSRVLNLPGQSRMNLLIKQYERERQGLSAIEQKQFLRRLISPELLASFSHRFHPEQVSKAKESTKPEETPRILFTGKPIGGSVLVGKLATTLDQAQAFLQDGNNVIYISESITNAEEVLGLSSKSLAGRLAVVTKIGSPHSHSANILNSQGIVGAIGCGQTVFAINSKKISFNDDEIVEVGQILSIDGVTGEVFKGEMIIAGYDLTDKEKTIIFQRKELGVSMWETMSKILNLQDQVYGLEKKLDRFLIAQKQGQGWKSPKAQAQEIINFLFSQECRTQYNIVDVTKAGYKQRIKKLIKFGWNNNFDITVRSAFTLSKDGAQLGVNPWFLFKPGENDKLEEFLNGDKDSFPDHKYGSLARWKTLEDELGETKLTEVLIGYNHSGKLDQDKAHLHAVGAIRMSFSNQLKIEGTIHPATFHLRTFELSKLEEQSYDPENEIHFEAYPDSRFEYGIGRVNFSFGLNHIDQSKVDKFIEQLIKLNYCQARKELSLSHLAVYQELAGQSGVLTNSSDFQLTDFNETKFFLMRMIKEAKLSSLVLENLVLSKSWLQANELVQEILSQQLINISPGLAVIENWLSRQSKNIEQILGEVSAEFQAKIPPGTKMRDKGNWWSLYGIKGMEEMTLGK